MNANRKAAAALAVVLCASLQLASHAVKKDTPVKAPPPAASDTPGFTAIALIPASSEQVVVLSESASVKVIRSASASTIGIKTNCPRNWNVTGSIVRQAGFAKPRGGVAMMADALGSRAIVNGKIYLMPSGPMHGISMGKDGVTVGGQKLPALAGSDLPGACDGPDVVEIIVPESYTGDLMMGLATDSAATVDGWTGGKVECTLTGTSTISATKLKSLSKAVLDVRGEGKAEIGDLTTKVFVANVAGNGKVNVKNGFAEISNATVAGGGSVNLKGKFANLQKVVEGGQGSIQVSE